MNRYLYTDHIDVEQVVTELYDPQKPGVMSFPATITTHGQKELHEAALESRSFFEDAPRTTKSGVIQEMRTIYLARHEQGTLPAILTQRIRQLCEEYALIHQRIAEHAGFHTPFNSIGIHEYYAGSAGITPHQDFAADENLIASFVIKGNAEFYACKNREGDGSLLFDAPAGTLILMRAARNKKELKLRPFHYLKGPLLEDRYSILIRTLNKKKKTEAYG